MTVPPATHVACVLLAPWSLTLVERGQAGLPVAVLNEAGRVVHVNAPARLGGVDVGMKEAAALSRCPELHAEVVSAPTAQAAWNELLETLYARYSDHVEGREPGIAYLALGVSGARELAAALHAPVGHAASLEVAHLAALRAKPGEVREVASGKAEEAFLALTPLDHLTVLGLSPAHLERLRFLGLRGLADLLKWSAAQREAFLGVDAAKTLQRFLKGQRTTVVSQHTPGQIIEASLSTDQPLMEPGETAAVLAELIPVVWAELRGRTCAYLTLHADTVGGRLSVSRRLKGPVDGAGLERLAVQGLETTDALALGIERITVQLSGLAQPARMVGLWAGIAELQVTADVLERFPDALVKVHWLDPWAYVADARYEWVDWLTGEVRPTPLTPPRPAPMSRAKRHENAVNRVLAFFEGAAP